MKLDYELIGKRIRKIRKEKNLKQEDICFAADISKTHMSHIETGSTKLALPALVKIANALDTGVDNILGSNLRASTPVFQREITDILDDCSPYELQVMVDTMVLIKESMRNKPKDSMED